MNSQFLKYCQKDLKISFKHLEILWYFKNLFYLKIGGLGFLEITKPNFIPFGGCHTLKYLKNQHKKHLSGHFERTMPNWEYLIKRRDPFLKSGPIVAKADYLVTLVMACFLPFHKKL